MSDVAKQTITATFDFVLKKDDEGSNQTRSISFDIDANEITETIRQNVLDYRSMLLGSMSTFIQPLNWRDDDAEESVWQTTAITAKLISKMEVILDPEG